MNWFTRWLFRPILFRLDQMEINLMTASADLTTNVQTVITAINSAIVVIQASTGNDPAVVAANAALVTAAASLNQALDTVPASPPASS